jgi:ketosteroid isomerase-like protein
MSEESTKAVRLPMAVATRSRRSVEQRLAVRFPRVATLFIRTIQRLPPNSRLRLSLIRRLTRQGTEALNRGDFEAVFGFYAPDDCEFDAPELLALGLDGTHGREARIRFQRRWIADWGEFRFNPDQIIGLGDGRRVMLMGRITGSGRSSGAPFDDEWAAILTIRAGQIIREQAFFDHAKALEAAGLSE